MGKAITDLGIARSDQGALQFPDGNSQILEGIRSIPEGKRRLKNRLLKTTVGAALRGRPFFLKHAYPEKRAATEGRPYSCLSQRSYSKDWFEEMDNSEN